MSRHGKLSDSPFQVEDQFYHYALEHENDNDNSHINQSKGPVCKYYSFRTQCCKLWNSGCKRCLDFKCKFLHQEIRRKASCKQCGYMYNGICFHSRENQIAPNKVRDYAEAEYCCYYMDHEPEYSKLQKIIKRHLDKKHR